MASVEEETNPASSAVVTDLFRVLFPVTDNNALFEKEMADFLYSKYLIDNKQTRMVRTGGLFEDCPTMETEYFFIAALPPTYDLESENAEADATDDSEEKESDDEDCCGGYWMLFFSKAIIDDMWKKACRLLREGRLEGVNAILVSTSRRSPRATKHGDSVLFFSSSPWSNETLMQCLGHHIAVQMSYFSYTKYLHYKPRSMISFGTRATGNLINSLIRVPVPETILDVLEKKKRLQGRLNKPKLYQQWLMNQRIDYRDHFTGWFRTLRFAYGRSSENLPQFEYSSCS